MLSELVTSPRDEILALCRRSVAEPGPRPDPRPDTRFDDANDALRAGDDTARRAGAQLGVFAHQLQSLLGGALLAFGALRDESVGIRSRTGDALEHNLVALRDLVDRSLTEVRLTTGIPQLEHIAVAQLLDDIEVSAGLGARSRGVVLAVGAVDATLTVDTDRQILSSIVSTLLQNAFKYTRSHTRVWLRTSVTTDRVRFEIEDQCGGISLDELKLLRLHEPPRERGTGLALCVRGAIALRGAIRVRNQNHGCVFTVELPRGQA